MHTIASMLALLLAAAAPAAEPGKISGRVTVAGLAPKLANLPVTRDMKICGTSKPDPAVVVGKGGAVKDAVVWLVDGPPPKRGEKRKVKLDQRACEFVPHVLAAPVGAELDIVNSDKLFHNVHGADGETKSFNYAMPVPDYVIPTGLQKPGAIRVTCDVHPWMRAWVQVLPTTAFAVTDEAGSFAIPGVPPGKYTLKLWHERLGERQQMVDVAAGETAKVDLSIAPR